MGNGTGTGSELYVGLMSGTSLDGVDAVLADLGHTPPRVLATAAHGYPEELRAGLLALCTPGADELARMARLDAHLGRLFAQVVLQLLASAGVEPGRVSAIGSHGQTVRHYPEPEVAQSIQIGDPNLIAELTGVTTVADFRRRDMAAGGEGAPLVPAFHAEVFRRDGVERVIVNIGGIANVTVLPPHPATRVTGFDTGPGNVLLDAWCHAHLDRPMDRDGHWAESGRPASRLLELLLDDPFFRRPPPKSTGREQFNLGWVEERLRALPSALEPEDVQATLVALTAASIALAIAEHAPQTREVYVCGGGTRNPVLMRALQARVAPRRVSTTAALGLEPRWVEAVALAWLAQRRLRGLPGNLPAVTGARAPVTLGGIYPGQLRASMPEQRPRP
jgi:anhydro-N-acetylmuramic acid kinase